MDDAGRKRIHSLPYLARCEIYGGGIIANFAFALLLVGIASAITSATDGAYLFGILRIGLASLLSLLLIRFQRFVSGTTFFLLGTGLLVLIIATVIMESTPAEEIVGGPVALINIFSELVSAYLGVIGGLYLGALFSFTLGLSNMLPFLPFDGGHLAESFTRFLIGEKRYEQIKMNIKIGLVVPGLLFILLALTSDLIRILRQIF